jgi:rod shape-determining protein MreD
MVLAGKALLVGFVSLLVQGILQRCGVADYFIPQCIVVVVVFLAFYEISLVGASLAFVLGLLTDLAAGHSLGPWAGACVTVYGVFVLLSQRLFIDSGPVAMAVSALSVVLAQLLYLSIESNRPEFSLSLLAEILASAVCSGLCAPLVFALLARRVGKVSSPVSGRSTVLTSL